MMRDLEDARPACGAFGLNAIPNDLLDCLKDELTCDKHVLWWPLVDFNANTKAICEGLHLADDVCHELRHVHFGHREGPDVEEAAEDRPGKINMGLRTRGDLQQMGAELIRDSPPLGNRLERSDVGAQSKKGLSQ